MSRTDGRAAMRSGPNADDDEVDDMPYILCELDRAAGEVRLLAARTFDSQGEATRALATAQASRPSASSEVFLIDLDAATPVVVVPVEGDVPPVGTAPEPGPVIVPEEPWATAEEPETPATADETDEGSAGLEWPFVAAEDAAVGPTLLADERADDDVARSELWWVEVGAEDDAPTPYEAGPELVTYGADAEDIADVAAELSALVGEPPREEPLREEPPAEQVPLQMLDDAFGAADRAPADATDDLPDAADLAPDAFEAGGYEAGATQDDARLVDEYETNVDAGLVEAVEDATFVRMDFDAWRCTDCVFTSTCPRTGVDRPASCGSFQWRTE